MLSSSQQPQQIYKICFTGGPCAGKTTAINEIKANLTQQGWKVFSVLEVPTMTIQGGGMIVMDGLDAEQTLQFHTLLVKAQMNLEEYFIGLAKVSRHQKCVILFDRGVMDAKGYMSGEQWVNLLDFNSWNEVHLRDQRYDAVIHLVTAAQGAAEKYTLENNVARFEDAATAIFVDQALQRAWNGHANHTIVNNEGKTLQDKIKISMGVIEDILGLERSEKNISSSEMKELQVKGESVLESIFKDKSIPNDTFTIEEISLEDTNSNLMKLIKRGKGGYFSYYQIRKRNNEKDDSKINNNTNIQTQLISLDQFILLKASSAANSSPIIKHQQVFLLNGVSYKLESKVSQLQSSDEKISQLYFRQISQTSTTLPEFLSLA